MLPEIPTYTFIQTYTFINFQQKVLPIRLFPPILLLIFKEISHLYFYSEPSSIWNSRVDDQLKLHSQINSILPSTIVSIGGLLSLCTVGATSERFVPPSRHTSGTATPRPQHASRRSLAFSLRRRGALALEAGCLQARSFSEGMS